MDKLVHIQGYQKGRYSWIKLINFVSHSMWQLAIYYRLLIPPGRNEATIRAAAKSIAIEPLATIMENVRIIINGNEYTVPHNDYDFA